MPSTITCPIEDLAAICARLESVGVVYSARPCTVREGGSDDYLITIHGH